MAAHGLTIMRQILTVLREQPHRAEDYTRGALSAPGTCFTAGFSMDAWEAIDRTIIDMARGMATHSTLREVVQGALVAHIWMEVYPTLEAVRAAKHRYVKPGKPYWTRRMAQFDAGNKAAHVKARRMVADTHPLTNIHEALLRDWSEAA